jgi:hypothetical protein
MRRAFLALALGGVLLSAAACDSDAETTGTAAAPAATITPSAAPIITGPDYSANTKLVCGKVEGVFTKDLEAFGSHLGKMIAYKEAKQSAEAEKAEAAAKKQLKDVGTKLRKETAAADDPALVAAGQTSAAKFTKSAADTKFFDGIKSTKDLDRTIEAKMTDWLSPVAGYCAA